MKLLTRDEALVKKQKDESVELNKKQQLTEGITELLREFNATKLKVAEDTAKLERDSLLKIGELDTQKSQLSLDVRELENRKVKALEPLIEREEWIKKHELDIEITANQLANSWEEFKLKRSNLDEETNLLIKRSKEVKTDEIKIREGFVRLARQIRNFEKRLKDQDDEDNKQRLYFVLRDKELKEREEEIGKVTEANAREKTALENYRLKLDKENDHIISQQRTLKAGFQSLKKKQDDSQ